MKKIMILLLMLSLFIISCKPATQPVVSSNGEIPGAEEEPTGIATQTEIPQEPSEPAASQTLLTEVRCVDNKISGVLANPKSTQITLAKDYKVMINGLIIVDPECDSLIIEPGKSVFCADLTGHLIARAGKLNNVKINYAHTSVIEDVLCP